MTNSNDAAAAAEARDAAESVADLERGALPLQAQRRLAQESGAHPVFATDLSVDEFLLARQLGYDAVGQVLGSSIYHLGWANLGMQAGWMRPSYSTGWELTTLTAAHMQARELAMGRMRQEAAALKAHGVVGVRLRARGYDWGADLIEFTAIGTAVRLQGVPPPQTPFLTDFSGEDFWTLLQSGYVPRGLVMGYCSYFTYLMGLVKSLWNPTNWEVGDFTQGIQQARHLAMQRMTGEARALEAHGIVGVKVDVQKHFDQEGGDSNNPAHSTLRVDFFALGTAIARAGEARSPQRSLSVLNLTGLRPVRSTLERAELQTS